MALLEVENLSKSFGGLIVIRELSFELDEGEILGLVGPNGSGKTTLFNLVTGFLKPDAGKIKFNKMYITGMKPHKICRIGIAKTFQLVRPFTHMTVLDNVVAGRVYGSDHSRSIKQARAEAEELLEFTDLGSRRLMLAGRLSLIDRKRLELARAIATKPRLLLLDEVMAGLNPTEMEDAMWLIKRIRDSGVTLMVVEHVMRAVLGISDRVIVLNVGEKIAEGTPQEVVGNKQVIEAYLGEE